MRGLLSTLAGVIMMLVATAGAAAEGAEATPAPRKPNLVIILADDLGWGDVGANGGQRIATPNIDALASSGVRFTDGYVAAAVCSPSRAALLTGRYPQRFGYHFNDNARPGLPVTETTLATRLKEAGYATGAIGKWQLGWSPEQRPTRRGFDEFFGFISGVPYVDPKAPGVETWMPAGADEGGGGLQRALYRGEQKVEEDGYLTDILTREAVDFIRRHSGEPFFLYLAHFAPHVPLQATAPYLDRYRHVADPATRIYSAMVSALDDGVGAVVRTLDELGLEQDTLVVFLSDNGCAVYLGGACCNDPLAGGKRYHLEGGIRVPFMISWPGRLPTGTVYSSPVSTMDVTATLLAAAGVNAAPGSLDGVDLAPYLMGARQGSPHERLFWRAGPNRAVREGSWKLWQVNLASEEAAAELGPTGIERGTLRRSYTAPPGSPLGQLTVLYDLSSDVGEHHNLAAGHPDVVRRLIGKLDEWNAELQGPSVDSTRGTVAKVEGELVELIF